jgi:mutator protein MutT
MIRIKMKRSKGIQGAVMVLLDRGNRTLLLERHPSSNFAPNKWGFPGGKIEEGESPLTAAVRETQEETSIEVQDVVELGRFSRVQAFLSRNYTGAVILDHEHTAWAWVSTNEMAQYDIAPNVWEIYTEAVKDGK